jgi:hypothetical protein
MKRRRGRAWIGRSAVGASVLAHVAVFLALFWHFGAEPTLAPVPAMTVTIERLATHAPPAAQATVRRGTARKAEAAPPQALPFPAAPPAPLAPSPLPGRAPDDVQAALRGLLGCNPVVLARLPRAERETCEQRLARRQVADLGPRAARLNLDPTGAFGKDPQAILERRPTRGCAARAGGDVAPMGEIGVAAGVACAKPF